MGILDNLTANFNADFPQLKGLIIKLKDVVHLEFNSNNKTTVINNTIIINPNDLKEKNKLKYSELIRNFVEDGEGYIIKDSSQRLIEDFKTVDSKDGNKQLISFFSDKIPKEDIQVLRAALYIRDIKDIETSKGTIDKIKRDISQRYGRKGSNIANLCTAHYFENLIKPLYEELSGQDDFTPEKFLTRYEVIVNEIPFAVFSNRVQSEEELKKEIIDKINRNRKYGRHTLNVHAIGNENVTKIENVLKDINKELTDVKKESTSGYIIVTIYF